MESKFFFFVARVVFFWSSFGFQKENRKLNSLHKVRFQASSRDHFILVIYTVVNVDGASATPKFGGEQ